MAAVQSGVPLRVALIGLGHVGGGLAEYIHEHQQILRQQYPPGMELTVVCRRDWSRGGEFLGPSVRRVTDWREAVHAPDVDVVVELIGGVDTARELITGALEAGRHVVTANKAVLSVHGPELAALAWSRRRRLLFEASVGAGVPVLRTIEEGIAGNTLRSFHAILNGTTMFILTTMESNPAASFDEVLAEAQRLGYAEAEASLDVDGHDAAHKMAVLSSLAFSRDVRAKDVHTEGIRHISPSDIRFALERNLRTRLLGSAWVELNGALRVCVRPAFVPASHALGSFSGVMNGFWFDADPLGPLFMMGPGAGKGSTVSGVVSDLVAVARRPMESLPPRLATLGGRRDGLRQHDLIGETYLRITGPGAENLHGKVLGQLPGAIRLGAGKDEGTWFLPEMARRSLQTGLGKVTDNDTFKCGTIEFALGAGNAVRG